MQAQVGVHDGDLDFEWFNTWWDQTRDSARRTAEFLLSPPVFPIQPQTPPPAAPRSAGHALAAATRAALLARDIADIESARDALYRGGTLSLLRSKSQGAKRAATDGAPIILGGVVGILVLSVFSAAAAVMKLARS